MNKTFKKIISLMLSVLMIMAVATVGFVTFAEGAESEEHVCVYDQKVIAEEYKAEDMSATDPAVFYYSCKCGASSEGTDGEVTFEEHRMVWQIAWSFILEIYHFFKYIFYDVFLGKAP